MRLSALLGRPAWLNVPATLDGRHAWTLLHAALLVAAGAVLLVANRGQWFFGDEWDFIAQRDLRQGPDVLFAPHNEHWSTLPILAYRALLNLFGLRQYWPFVLLLVTLHLLVAHLFWRHLRRIQVHPAVAAAATALFALLGAGSENLLWAFQIGFVGSVAFGWLGAVAVSGNRLAVGHRVTACVAGIAAVMCSGIGVTMVVFIAAASLLRHGFKDALLIAGVPGAAFLAWYASYGHLAADPTGNPDAAFLLRYVPLGLSNALGVSLGSHLLGAPALIGLVYVCWHLRAQLRGTAALAAAGCLAAVFHFAVTGVGRANLGVDQARAGRYVYIGFALLLPMLVLLLDRACSILAARCSWAPTVVVLGLTCSTSLNVVTLFKAAEAERLREQPLRSVILASAPLLQSSSPVVRPLPEPVYSPDLSASSLVRIAERGWLPETQPTTVDVLSARANLQSSLQPAVGPQPADAVVSMVAHAVAEPEGGGCASYTAADTPPLPIVTISSSSRQQNLLITPSAAGFVLVSVRDSLTDAEGNSAYFAVLPSTTYHLQVATEDDTMRVALPPGSTRVCGAPQ